MDEQLKQSALDFHECPVPGKIQVVPTKPLATQRDLALAYSPVVAAPCLEIEKDPLAAYKYTARGNLVAVVSNGTAVLGLGNIGALAGKPVMEVKGVLIKPARCWRAIWAVSSSPKSWRAATWRPGCTRA